jgi:hypothetical protein
MRKVITKGRSAKENLGELTFEILIGYILLVDLGDDITATTTETYRQTKWPTIESLRRSILEEYQSKLNARKTRPTAGARPSNLNEDPQLNLAQTGRKRKGEQLSSPEKRQKASPEEKKNWPTCPLCDAKHPIKVEGQCYLAKPETTPLNGVNFTRFRELLRLS